MHSSSRASDSYFECDWNEKIEDLSDLNLKLDLLNAMRKEHQEELTDFQKLFLNAVVHGHNVYAEGLSGFGMGKRTAAAIALLQMIDETRPAVQAIIISAVSRPSLGAAIRRAAKRAVLFRRDISFLADRMNIKCGAVISEKAKQEQAGDKDFQGEWNWQPGYQIVVGDIYGINEMIRDGHISRKDLKVIIVDGLNGCLESGQGFYKRYRMFMEIAERIPKNAKVLIFSHRWDNNKMPQFFQAVMNERPMVRISMHFSIYDMQHYRIGVENDNFRADTLFSLLEDLNKNLMVVVYTRMVGTAAKLFSEMNQKENVKEDQMDKPFFLTHYEMEDEESRSVVADFINGRSSRILFATDHLPFRSVKNGQLSLIINYDIPTVENYGHRIFRCGFGGSNGVIINFVAEDDKKIITGIENYYDINLRALPKTHDFFKKKIAI